MTLYSYQVCLLGDLSLYSEEIKAYLFERFNELGLGSEHLKFFESSNVNSRNRKAPCAVIFSGYESAFKNRHDELDALLEDSLLIVPIVGDLARFSEWVPKSISHFNGVEGTDAWSIACISILEHFKLLRSERRLFISYKRSESTSVAHQLYEAFDSRGYDVFLDTRSVLAGDDFQSVLWHRMADSDVVILLDSPKFHESQWTEEEYTRAIASRIHIEHLLWPNVTSKNSVAFDRFVPLEESDFKTEDTIGEDAKLKTSIVDRIVMDVESSRARALSARNLMLVDGFCDLAREFGFKADLQPGHSIQLLIDNEEIEVFPMAGVPSAMRMHNLIRASVGENPVWALFDSSGIVQDVVEHITWLSENLPMLAVPKINSRKILEELST